MKAALEGLGLVLGVLEALIVVVGLDMVDSNDLRGPKGFATSCMPAGTLASQVLLRSMASSTGPAIEASCMLWGILASRMFLCKVGSESSSPDMATKGWEFPAGERAEAGLGSGILDGH